MNKTDNLAGTLEKFEDQKILVIGDLILDHYAFGTVDRISPEAPIPIVNVTNESYVPGGAANTANNITSLGGQAYIVGIVGKDYSATILKDKLCESNITIDGLFVDPEKPTIRKERIIGHGQHMLRVDREKTDGYNKKTEKKLIDYTKNIIDNVDVIVISDYAKGTITEKLASEVIYLCKKHNKPIIVDPKPKNISFYDGATLVTPNQKEASEITNIENKLENVPLMGEKIREMLNSNILITQGKHEASLIELNGDITHIPTKAREVYDITGAGDTVVGTVALALAAGADLKEAAILANYAAGIVVGKVGTATTTVKEIKHLLN